MNRFRFRLESVLRLRAVREDEKKREFGGAMSRLHAEEAGLEGLRGELAGHESEMSSRGIGPVSPAMMQQGFLHTRVLDSRIDEQRNRIRLAVLEVDRKRSELIEATRRKKTVERLKDKAREEYDREVLREEQALIDELASLHHARKPHEP